MARTQRPNVLFFFTDDQRRDTIRALGNPEIETPTLDALVDRGTAFTRASIMGGTAPAVCMPSRAMLMTGRNLFGLVDSGHELPPEQVTLPEAFRAAGYRTHHVGKWHQDRASFQRSFEGADRIFGFTPGWYKSHGGHWHVAVHDYDPAGAYAPEDGYHLAADKKERRPVAPGAGGVHSSELFADAAAAFLEGYDEERPFFLYLSFVAPHDPREAPGPFEDRYPEDAVSTPGNFLPRHPFDNGELYIRDEMLEGFPRRRRAVRRHLAAYYAMITHADAEMGRVLAALEKSGRAESTLVVFAGDNGLAVGQHGLMGKQNLYEHSVGVPLLFAGPGVPAGERRPAGAYLYDIFPTLCELCDVPVPPSVQGQSLVPALRDPEQPVREALYYGYRSCQRAVRRGRYKLIEYVTGSGPRTQLFDLEEDPLELVNLADHAAHAGTLAELRAELRRQAEATGDTAHVHGRPFWEAYAADEG